MASKVDFENISTANLGLTNTTERSSASRCCLILWIKKEFPPDAEQLNQCYILFHGLPFDLSSISFLPSEFRNAFVFTSTLLQMLLVCIVDGFTTVYR